MEGEYDIPIEENLEKEVNYMCNLGEGIEERALERGITVGEAGGEAAIVKRMNKNGFTAEQIATATDKDVEEMEAILAGGEPVFALYEIFNIYIQNFISRNYKKACKNSENSRKIQSYCK